MKLQSAARKNARSHRSRAVGRKGNRGCRGDGVVLIKGRRVQHRPQRDRRARAHGGILLLPCKTLDLEPEAGDVNPVGACWGRYPRSLRTALSVMGEHGSPEGSPGDRAKYNEPAVVLLKRGEVRTGGAHRSFEGRSIDRRTAEEMQTPADVGVASRADAVKRAELGEIVSVEIVRLLEHGLHVEVAEITSQIFDLCALCKAGEGVVLVERLNNKRPRRWHLLIEGHIQDLGRHASGPMGSEERLTLSDRFLLSWPDRVTRH